MADLFFSTLQSLRAHALRFSLTSLGIVWGAFLLTYLTASMEGVSGHFIRELEEAGPKFVLLWPGAVLKNRVGQRGARDVELETEDVERIESLDAVEGAAPDISMWSQIVRANGRTKLFTVNGVSDRSQTIRNLRPAQGRFISALDVERGALLHDVGKIGIPDAILHKPGELNREEWIEMRRHPEIGSRILQGIKFLDGARPIVLCHQERYDGNGYPAGLKGNAIPLGARIFAVVDALDAMTSDRPYRKALPYESARAEIFKYRGTQFDPDVVAAFRRLVERGEIGAESPR